MKELENILLLIQQQLHPVLFSSKKKTFPVTDKTKVKENLKNSNINCMSKRKYHNTKFKVHNLDFTLVL